MAIVLEILNRNGRVQSTSRFDQQTLTLGRDYSNDLILRDPHVGPQHARLSFNEQQNHWQIENLSVVNPARLGSGVELVEPQPVASGELIVLGQTKVRLMLPQHPVAATKPLVASSKLLDYLSMPPVALLLLSALLLLTLLDIYLEQVSLFQWQELLLQSLLILLIPIFWALFWSLIGRLFAHDSRFAFHLSLGTLMLLVFHLFELVLEYGRFMFNLDSLMDWVALVFDAALTIGVLVLALTVATQLQQKRRWLVAAGLTFSLIGVSLLYEFSEGDGYQSHGDGYLLKPPFAMVQRPVPSDQFLAEMDELFTELDQAAEEQRQDHNINSDTVSF